MPDFTWDVEIGRPKLPGMQFWCWESGGKAYQYIWKVGRDWISSSYRGADSTHSSVQLRFELLWKGTVTTLSTPQKLAYNPDCTWVGKTPSTKPSGSTVCDIFQAIEPFLSAAVSVKPVLQKPGAPAGGTGSAAVHSIKKKEKKQKTKEKTSACGVKIKTLWSLAKLFFLLHFLLFSYLKQLIYTHTLRISETLGRVLCAIGSQPSTEPVFRGGKDGCPRLLLILIQMGKEWNWNCLLSQAFKPSGSARKPASRVALLNEWLILCEGFLRG